RGLPQWVYSRRVAYLEGRGPSQREVLEIARGGVLAGGKHDRPQGVAAHDVEDALPAHRHVLVGAEIEDQPVTETQPARGEQRTEAAHHRLCLGELGRDLRVLDVKERRAATVEVVLEPRRGGAVEGLRGSGKERDPDRVGGERYAVLLEVDVANLVSFPHRLLQGAEL